MEKKITTLRLSLGTIEVHADGLIIKTALAGMQHPNQDGTPRRGILKLCQEGESLTIMRERNNPKDRNAVAVMQTLSGQQIGYLPRDVAERVGPLIDQCVVNPSHAEISEFTGGPRSAGASLHIRMVFVGDVDARKIAESWTPPPAVPSPEARRMQVGGEELRRIEREKHAEWLSKRQVAYDEMTRGVRDELATLLAGKEETATPQPDVPF